MAVTEYYFNYIQVRASTLCKILSNYINKVEAQKANLNEYKRKISRRHVYEFGVYASYLQSLVVLRIIHIVFK